MPPSSSGNGSYQSPPAAGPSPFMQPISSTMAWRSTDESKSAASSSGLGQPNGNGIPKPQHSSSVGGTSSSSTTSSLAASSSFPPAGGSANPNRPSPFMQPVSAALGWLHPDANKNDNNNNGGMKSASQHGSSSSNNNLSTASESGRPSTAPGPFNQPVSAALGWLSNSDEGQLSKANTAADSDNTSNSKGDGSANSKSRSGSQEGQAKPAVAHAPLPDAVGFAAEYTCGRQLGEGAFAVVRECFNAEGERFAAKIVRKSAEEAKNAMIRREIAIMKELRHSPKVCVHVCVYVRVHVCMYMCTCMCVFPWFVLEKRNQVLSCALILRREAFSPRRILIKNYAYVFEFLKYPLGETFFSPSLHTYSYFPVTTLEKWIY